MAAATPNTALAALQSHLREQHPSIRLITPSDADFESARACFIRLDGDDVSSAPLAIARPQTAADVQALVRYCVAGKLDFVVRVGGHDCAGRSQVGGALTIDLRDIKHVVVNSGEQDGTKTARVGGGVLFRDLARELDARGLVTAVGTVASVGFTGWASLGGYGPFANHFGLGADQIVGAKIVNAKGELVDADAELLKGIRGGGGIFGIIVETTIKVYPLKEILLSMVVFESTDLKAAWTSYAAGYEKLLAEESVPRALQLQPFGLEFPGMGKVFAVGATWSLPDHDEGRRWIAKVAGFGNCIMNNPEAKSVTSYVEFNETLIAFGLYGQAYTLNFKKLTPKTAEVLAKHTALSPAGMAVSVHRLREPAANEGSVFGSRVDHHMLEIIAMTPVKDLEAKGAEWARGVISELKEADPDNILDSSYVSLQGDDADYRKVYGPHYDTLVALKKKLDPENVFKYAVPRLQ
ncbi:hypothetical protein SLS62_009087 [Diatrype stigma]|uniref:FAD-binding PCMH-type domain-containing protein n=1 Tax=Diatrype stigma TaxID=117547 RepID=A0AAN9YJQ1_9PEZI